MASWCQYHVGFNTGSLVELVTLQSIKEIFDTSDADILELEEKWVEQGYGFCTPMNFESGNEDILYELGDDTDCDNYIEPGRDGEIIIKDTHPNILKVLEVLKGLNIKYYDKNHNAISQNKFIKLIENENNYVLTICELEPPS